MRVRFKLVGDTPLLMHKDDVELADELAEIRTGMRNKGNKDGGKSKSKAGDDRSPPWSWQTYCYHDGKNLALPQENLMCCLLYAGTRITIPGKGNKTYKEASQTAITPMALHFALTVAEGRSVPWESILAVRDAPFEQHKATALDLGFRLFVKRAKIGSAKHVRVRPRFDAWSVTGSLDVDEKVIDSDTLKELFAVAGVCGLGDWRPTSPKRPGPYGRFNASLKLA